MSFLTQILSVKWNNPYALSPPPVLIKLDGMLTKIDSNISALHNLDLPPLVKGGQLILITSHGGGGNSEKLKKGGGSMVQGQFFLKGGSWYFYLIFARFIIFKFRNYFILSCKIALYVALCSTITSWKKFIQSCLNMNLKISHIKGFISLFVKGFKRLKIDFW